MFLKILVFLLLLLQFELSIFEFLFERCVLSFKKAILALQFHFRLSWLEKGRVEQFFDFSELEGEGGELLEVLLYEGEVVLLLVLVCGLLLVL